MGKVETNCVCNVSMNVISFVESHSSHAFNNKDRSLSRGLQLSGSYIEEVIVGTETCIRWFSKIAKCSWENFVSKW